MVYPSAWATNIAVFDQALDIGVTFLDAADMYGVGRNEQLLAHVLRRRRAEVVCVHPIAALQTEYSLWTRDAERDSPAACRKCRVGFGAAHRPPG